MNFAQDAYKREKLIYLRHKAQTDVKKSTFTLKFNTFVNKFINIIPAVTRWQNQHETKINYLPDVPLHLVHPIHFVIIKKSNFFETLYVYGLNLLIKLTTSIYHTDLGINVLNY